MANSTRTQRVADMLQRVLAELIHREIKDPRLTLVSITGVDVSRDLAHAKVFMSIIGDEKKIEDAMKALEKASGFLRHNLADRCDLRIVPQLHFFHDKTVIQGRYMSDLIDKARAKDSKDDEEQR